MVIDELNALEAAVQALADRVDSCPTFEDQIDVGHTLWRISSIASKALGPIKTNMRKQAMQEAGGQGIAKFAGKKGSTKITIPHPKFEFTESGVDQFRRMVPCQTFNSIVDVRVSYRVDRDALIEYLEGVPTEERGTLMRCFRQKKQTPRVSFNT